MVLNQCSMPSGSIVMASGLCGPICGVSACVHSQREKSMSSSIRSAWGRHLESKARRGFHPLRQSDSRIPFTNRDLVGLQHTIPILTGRRRPLMTPQASFDIPTTFRYPAMNSRPKWYWRVFASIPYILPLHQPWMFAETAYHLYSLFEEFEFATYPFLSVFGRLPRWSLIAYFILAYLGIVRRKEWPHFFRYHVAMSMLMEIGLQMTGAISRWIPSGFYWGKIGMHFWTAFGIGFFFTVLECMRCALTGMYADVPFACEAAYIQIPYD